MITHALLCSSFFSIISGWLLIAEVRSRFDPATGGADPEKFCDAVQRLGFSIVSRVCAMPAVPL